MQKDKTIYRFFSKKFKTTEKVKSLFSLYSIEYFSWNIFEESEKNVT